jgi:hypothetical protein
MAAVNVSSSASFAKAFDGLGTAAWAKAFDGLGTSALAKSLLDSVKFPDTSAALTEAMAAVNVSSSASFAKAFDGLGTAAWAKALDGLGTSAWAKTLVDGLKLPDLSPLAQSLVGNATLHADAAEAPGEITADAARASAGQLDAVFLVTVLVLLTGALYRIRAQVIVAEVLSEVVRSLWSLWVDIFQLKSESAAADLLFNVLVFEVGRRMTPPPDDGP